MQDAEDNNEDVSPSKNENILDPASRRIHSWLMFRRVPPSSSCRRRRGPNIWVSALGICDVELNIDTTDNDTDCGSVAANT